MQLKITRGTKRVHCWDAIRPPCNKNGCQGQNIKKMVSRRVSGKVSKARCFMLSFEWLEITEHKNFCSRLKHSKIMKITTFVLVAKEVY
jgi:hypothetical protein